MANYDFNIQVINADDLKELMELLEDMLGQGRSSKGY